LNPKGENLAMMREALSASFPQYADRLANYTTQCWPSLHGGFWCTVSNRPSNRTLAGHRRLWRSHLTPRRPIPWGDSCLSLLPHLQEPGPSGLADAITASTGALSAPRLEPNPTGREDERKPTHALRPSTCMSDVIGQWWGRERTEAILSALRSAQEAHPTSRFDRCLLHLPERTGDRIMLAAFADSGHSHTWLATVAFTWQPRQEPLGPSERPPVL